MVKPEKFDRLHLVYHFAVPLSSMQDKPKTQNQSIGLKYKIY